MVDTHCHLNIIIKKEPEVTLSPNYLPIIDTIISEAYQHDVHTIINVGTSIIESANSITIAKHNSHVYASIGIHPTDLTVDWKKDVLTLGQWAAHKNEHKIVAIGECGLDLFHKKTSLALQKDGFKAQIELALEYALPLIVHSRNAYEETLRVLEPYIKDLLKGVFHCFSYDKAFATQAIDWGFMLGIGGTITYPKNDILKEVVRTCPIDHIVLETDAPFLPIQSMRGKMNHPLYISFIAEVIAEIKQNSKDTIASTTTKNAHKLFNILMPENTSSSNPV
ncbi:MAG TPA: TatD family hydrolase [Patescibacteria group bacterium]|jgi:TatD DNase family protein|nr:TatD family hydrolase [Patescibacteria group bacterium]